MTQPYITNKPSLTLFTCISVLSLLAACGTPTDGYYDRNGNWIATNSAHQVRSPLPGGTNELRDGENDMPHPHYSRRGYYDYNGDYVAKGGSIKVGKELFPPRGMCRVWFTDRLTSEQPDIESCDDIQLRVPAGAYVIYGG